MVAIAARTADQQPDDEQSLKNARLFAYVRKIDRNGLERKEVYRALIEWCIGKKLISVPGIRRCPFTMGLVVEGLVHRVGVWCSEERPVSQQSEARTILGRSVFDALADNVPTKARLTIAPDCAPKAPLLVTNAFTSINYVVGGAKVYLPDMTLRQAMKVIANYRNRIAGLFEGIAPLLDLVEMVQQRTDDMDAPFKGVITEHEANVAASRAKLYRQQGGPDFSALWDAYRDFATPDFENPDDQRQKESAS